MSDAASNERFHDSSFLQGQNAAYVEQLYAAYARNPASVDPSWQRYFAELGDSAENVAAGAAGAPWQRPDWPPEPNRSEEHTSELQSRGHLVCRLLPEKKAT